MGYKATIWYPTYVLLSHKRFRHFNQRDEAVMWLIKTKNCWLKPNLKTVPSDFIVLKELNEKNKYIFENSIAFEIFEI